LESLVKSVFTLNQNDSKLGILVDLPDNEIQDSIEWKQRREIALSWYRNLSDIKSNLGLESIDIIYYENVHNNNADLPEHGYLIESGKTVNSVQSLISLNTRTSFHSIFANYQIFLALTQFSATAPLKINAKKYNFRAATMPGFTADMIPALRLDYNKINERVMIIKDLLDPATGIHIQLLVDESTEYPLFFDIRHRAAHASGGRFPETGIAGNLPSGECYIVPYEGELKDESLSYGILPVQLADEIVLYEIEENVARRILSKGRNSSAEAQKLEQEPAYGNISEIGFGILNDFGIKPTGSILLDEKLGLHIAFGRSDHFGGAVGIKDFNDPANVIHLDRIYIPETQPRVRVVDVTLEYPDRNDLTIIKDWHYTIFS